MIRKLSRRELLKSSAGAVGLGVGGPVQQPASGRAGSSSAAAECLIFVCLRGGADALGILIPHANQDFYRARVHLASRKRAPALELDDRFRLPATLAGLKPLYQSGELGFVLGAGLTNLPALHRDAQRALDDALARAAGERPIRAGGTFAEQCRQATALLQSAKPPRALQLESFGWDTHVGQGGARPGRLVPVHEELARGLLSLAPALRASGGRATLIVVSEFGRTVRENRAFGTDDGLGQVVLLQGAPGRYGRVAAPPLDLTPAALSGGRSLPIHFELGALLAGVAEGKAP